MPDQLTPEQKQALEWAMTHDFQSVAAKYARELAKAVLHLRINLYDAATSPWQFTEPTEPGLYLIKYSNFGKMQYRAAFRRSTGTWAFDNGSTVSFQILAWARLNEQ